MALQSDANVLIIGGSGFLSGTLAAIALGQGHHVWTLTRGLRRPAEGTVNLVADRNEARAFAQAIAGAATAWDLVVDCIAFTPAHIAQDLSVLRGRAKHLIVVSTDFVYDPHSRRFPQNEDDAVYLTDGYGGKKRQAEVVLQTASPSTLDGMRWTVVRPGHIYGPGSQLGCLPHHGRDPHLLARMQRGEPLTLVGGGHFLQQPIFAPDVAETILSLGGEPKAYGQVLNVAGPDVIESRTYYAEVAAILGVELAIETVSADAHLAAHPEAASFLCHRFYDLSRLAACNAVMPATPLADGLRRHVAWLQQTD